MVNIHCQLAWPNFKEMLMQFFERHIQSRKHVISLITLISKSYQVLKLNEIYVKISTENRKEKWPIECR